ncbi:hypothetical protein LIER_00333 [Lithospermum erythrorhizon]|uniref:Copia protein n=1 Tax=Lithospermum erythrorhizon TaxID=34254 RepID=A0AAV3NGZ2_LITER
MIQGSLQLQLEAFSDSDSATCPTTLRSVTGYVIKLDIHIAHNPVFHERTKHIDIDYHFTREKVLEGSISLVHLPTSEQLAYLLPKILPTPQHNYLIDKLGLFHGRPQSACGGC